MNLSTKRKVVDLYVLRKRLIEEEPLLRREMESYIRFFMKVRKDLLTDINTLLEKVRNCSLFIALPHNFVKALNRLLS